MSIYITNDLFINCDNIDYVVKKEMEFGESKTIITTVTIYTKNGSIIFVDKMDMMN